MGPVGTYAPWTKKRTAQRKPEVTRMAICRKMPACAALTNRTLLEAIESERSVTEKVVLSVLWGCV